MQANEPPNRTSTFSTSVPSPSLQSLPALRRRPCHRPLPPDLSPLLPPPHFPPLPHPRRPNWQWRVPRPLHPQTLQPRTLPGVFRVVRGAAVAVCAACRDGGEPVFEVEAGSGG
jgi:hypothetical protein